MAMVETTPISGVVRFATIAGPAMAKTRALFTLEFNGNSLRTLWFERDVIGAYRPRGLPNTRIRSQSGITITAPSRK